MPALLALQMVAQSRACPEETCISDADIVVGISRTGSSLCEIRERAIAVGVVDDRRACRFTDPAQVKTVEYRKRTQRHRQTQSPTRADKQTEADRHLLKVLSRQNVTIIVLLTLLPTLPLTFCFLPLPTLYPGRRTLRRSDTTKISHRVHQKSSRG